MKSPLLAAFLIFIPLFSYADDVTGLYLGIGQWTGAVKGKTGEESNATTLDDLGFNSNNNNVFWLNLEHVVPVLPNFRIMYTDIATSADAIINQSFSLGGAIFDADIRVTSKLVLSHTDATFYYEILDNWVELDLGITARMFDGYVEAQSELTPYARSPLAGALPMLYVNARVDLPFSGLFVGWTGNAIRYRGDGFYDYATRIGYFHDIPGMDFGINIGYRVLSLDVKEFDDLYVDASVSGIYLEGLIHF